MLRSPRGGVGGRLGAEGQSQWASSRRAADDGGQAGDGGASVPVFC